MALAAPTVDFPDMSGIILGAQERANNLINSGWAQLRQTGRSEEQQSRAAGISGFGQGATASNGSNRNYRADSELARGIIETANAIGADPEDLATVISYETGGTFDPRQPGPTTQWGQHRGLIQFGEPQASEHGVDWNDPIGSQLGPNGAVASYFRSSGYRPGMSFLDLYSTANAGAPGLGHRSDANNGGAPGTVADKVNNQMADHRIAAARLLGVSQ